MTVLRFENPEDDAYLLAAIVDSSDDAIISKDLNGIVTSWNRSAERIFGYAASEMIGQPITVLMPPDRIAEESQILAHIMKGERLDHFETVRQRKDGRLIDISLTISPVRSRDGTVIGASKIARDITEKRCADDELRRNQAQFLDSQRLAHVGSWDRDV